MATIGEDVEGMAEGRKGREMYMRYMRFFRVSHERGRGGGGGWKGSGLYVRMANSWFESLIGCHVKNERRCKAHILTQPIHDSSVRRNIVPPIRVTYTALVRQRHSPVGVRRVFGSQFSAMLGSF